MSKAYPCQGFKPVSILCPYSMLMRLVPYKAEPHQPCLSLNPQIPPSSKRFYRKDVQQICITRPVSPFAICLFGIFFTIIYSRLVHNFILTFTLVYIHTLALSSFAYLSIILYCHRSYSHNLRQPYAAFPYLTILSNIVCISDD